MKRGIVGIAGLLCVLGIGASVNHFLSTPYNPGFVEHPLITGLHVVLGALYLSIAPFQFVARIRDRWPRYHRLAGRVGVTIGLVVGVSAFFLATVIPTSGWSERIIVGGFAIFFTFSIARALLLARAGRYAVHREWMIRAFSIGMSIATMRLMFVPALIATGGPTVEQIQLFSIVTFTIAFVIHATGAELWIRATRPKAARDDGATAVDVGGSFEEFQLEAARARR